MENNALTQIDSRSSDDSLNNLIYEIRGKQVMLDSDLARLYQCKNGTKSINLAVKRHFDRFPKDFCFQLSESEYSNLKFQFETSSLNVQSSHGGIRKLPFAFTEQGVAMLATILKTEVASKMSISIMRAFVAMRHYVSTNLLEQKYINNLVMEDHDKIKALEDNSFHDRYFILDNKTVYHCGASVNRIGYKTFSINLIEDREICEGLIGRL